MCTCRYCLCFFNVTGIINICNLAMLIGTYTFLGNMPPSYTMAIGFWLLFYTNYFGMYVAFLAEATFYRNQDVWWINRLTEWGIIACSICFFLGAFLFFIPVSGEAMMSFSTTYFKIYGDIPPFLDKFQKTVKCCGIYNYTDYGRHDFTDFGYGSKGFYVYRQANPSDDFWHQLVTDLTLNRTVARKTTGLDVPQSCCLTGKATSRRHKDCGKKVEYTGSTTGDLYFKQVESANQKINDPKMGCYEKYSKMWDAAYKTSLTYLIGSIQIAALFQCFLFLVLLWFHKLALKTIRQLNYWLPALVELHESVELARAHADLEAEADAAHERDEYRTKGAMRNRTSHHQIRKSLKRTKSFHRPAPAQKEGAETDVEADTANSTAAGGGTALSTLSSNTNTQLP